MTEKELIEGLSRGDRAAFRELVEDYKKKVYYFALDMVGNQNDAEDISQEVFLKVFRSFKTFRKDAKLSSWLYRVAYNTTVDSIRKRAVTPESMEARALEAAAEKNLALTNSVGPDPAREAEQVLLQEKIEKALQKVSEQERAVFLLRHYDDLLIRDIAEVLGISIGSVKSYLFRAVKKLQRELAVEPAGNRTDLGVSP